MGFDRRRRIRTGTTCVVAVLCLLWVADPVPGPPLQAAGGQELAAPQPEVPVSLTLRIPEPRRFRLGELIPFELVFESAVRGRFEVNPITGDRSGRLTIDELRIEPSALVKDPFVDYSASLRGIAGGGAFNTRDPGEAPVTVSLHLNEWFRFDVLGTYSLSVRSGRVRESGARGPVVPVDSNSVTFEILPRDETWEAAELARGIQLLNAPVTTDDYRLGCSIVRHLGTNAAVTEMVRRFRPEERCTFRLALFAAPDRAHVVRELEGGLRRADGPVSHEYLQTLAALSVYLEHPELTPSQAVETKGRLAAPDDYVRLLELIDEAVARYAQAR